MFPSKREISRSNRRTGDNLSKRESPVQNGRVGTYARDSCINHLLSITHETHSSFDGNFEMRGGFFLLSQRPLTTYDTMVWYIYCVAIEYLVNLDTFTDFFFSLKQTVVLSNQCSSWGNVKASVPHGSVLGPLLFLGWLIKPSEMQS